MTHNYPNFEDLSDPNFEEKLTFCLKKNTMDIINFDFSKQRFENLHIDRLILQKVCKICAKKYRGENVTVTQSLNRP